MKRLLGVGLAVLAGCSGGSGPVGENSADSITTTAVGNVVAAQPTPTPTPTPTETAAPADDNGAKADGSATANAAAASDVAQADASHDD